MLLTLQNVNAKCVGIALYLVWPYLSYINDRLFVSCKKACLPTIRNADLQRAERQLHRLGTTNYPPAAKKVNKIKRLKD